MPANRKEPESAPFWFQRIKSPTWQPPTELMKVARMAASYNRIDGALVIPDLWPHM